MQFEIGLKNVKNKKEQFAKICENQAEVDAYIFDGPITATV